MVYRSSVGGLSVPSKKKRDVSRLDFYKKRGGWAVFFFCYLLFPIACFLYTLLPSPRDVSELVVTRASRKEGRIPPD